MRSRSNIIHEGIFVLIVISVLIVVSCSTQKNLAVAVRIIGKWKIVELDTGEEVEEELKEEYNKLKEQMISSSYFNFNADKTFSMSMFGQEMSGSWFYDIILERLETTPEGSKDSEFFLIEFPDSKHMQMKSTDEHGKINIKLERQ